MKNSFFNKHALICGSTDGIGKESAIQLAKNGCEVFKPKIRFTLDS